MLPQGPGDGKTSATLDDSLLLLKATGNIAQLWMFLCVQSRSGQNGQEGGLIPLKATLSLKPALSLCHWEVEVTGLG